MLFAALSWPPIPIFDLGPLRLSLHGLFAALGFLGGGWLAGRRLRRLGLDGQAYQSVLSWALIGALFGARYLTAPAALVDGVPVAVALHPLHGSFSIMGGFAGGIVAGLWRMSQVGLPRLETLDASSFGLALGTVIGRVGDLAIVEHLGRPTAVWWGYAVRVGYDLAPQHDGLECGQAATGVCGVYHPVMLYDLLGAAILLGLLAGLAKVAHLRPGQLFAVWMVWYGFQRALLDGLRFGNGDAAIGPFTWNQVSGAAAGMLGLFFLVRFRLIHQAPNTEYTRAATGTSGDEARHGDKADDVGRVP